MDIASNNCRVDGSTLTPVLDFGRQPLGNGFLESNQIEKEYFFPMEIGFSEHSRMLQLIKQPSPDLMFHENYAFFSSTSTYMKKHFADFADSIYEKSFLSTEDPFVIELGCNDGILLKNFASRGVRHLGIEPSLNVAKEANKSGVKTISEFFSSSLAESIVESNGQVDAFIAANVMCHIPTIRDVVRGIKILLKKKGVVIFEDPYLGDIVRKTSYDQIYDEHIYLFSGLSIQYLFGLEDLELIDLIPQTTHGGSMRYVLAHKGEHNISPNVERILEEEINQGLHKLSTFNDFAQSVQNSRKNLVSLLNDLKSQGKSIAGYAATSKSTTILNYCNIGKELIDYICDTTPIKHGKLSPGVHIPVVPYAQFKTDPPDYAFLFAWNHATEILEKESSYSNNGGKWITHVPEVKIFS